MPVASFCAIEAASDLRHTTIGDVEDDRHRTVVDKVHDHVGAEAAVLHRHPGRLDRIRERFENRNRVVG